MSLSANDSLPDAILVERFRRGERRAFDEIVIRYRRDIYRLSYRLTGTHEDADDVAQETFARAFGSLSRFRGESALKTWLVRIALNLAASAGRAKSRRRSHEASLGAEPAGDPVIPEADRRLQSQEETDRVRSAVRGLPPRQRQVVILRMYEELQFKEIAELLGCPIGTVKANFFHAMKNLKKALA